MVYLAAIASQIDRTTLSLSLLWFPAVALAGVEMSNKPHRKGSFTYSCY